MSEINASTLSQPCESNSPTPIPIQSSDLITSGEVSTQPTDGFSAINNENAKIAPSNVQFTPPSNINNKRPAPLIPSLLRKPSNYTNKSQALVPINPNPNDPTTNPSTTVQQPLSASSSTSTQPATPNTNIATNTATVTNSATTAGLTRIPSMERCTIAQPSLTTATAIPVAAAGTSNISRSTSASGSESSNSISTSKPSSNNNTMIPPPAPASNFVKAGIPLNHPTNTAATAPPAVTTAFTSTSVASINGATTATTVNNKENMNANLTHNNSSSVSSSSITSPTATTKTRPSLAKYSSNLVSPTTSSNTTGNTVTSNVNVVNNTVNTNANLNNPSTFQSPKRKVLKSQNSNFATLPTNFSLPQNQQQQPQYGNNLPTLPKNTSTSSSFFASTAALKRRVSQIHSNLNTNTNASATPTITVSSPSPSATMKAPITSPPAPHDDPPSLAQLDRTTTHLHMRRVSLSHSASLTSLGVPSSSPAAHRSSVPNDRNHNSYLNLNSPLSPTSPSPSSVNINEHLRFSPLSAKSPLPAATDGTAENPERIQVVVRCRPFLNASQTHSLHDANTSKSIVSVHNDATLTISSSSSVAANKSASKQNTYTYDRVFDMNATQEDVYTYVSNTALQVLHHTNTRSGKTHTMGSTDGIVNRVIHDIFTAKSTATDSILNISVEYLEIYNERCYDLLANADTAQPLSPSPLSPSWNTGSNRGGGGNENDKQTLEVRENPDGSFYVDGLTRVAVENPQVLQLYIQKGTACRMTTSTVMNAASSRSHSVLTLIVERISPHTHTMISSAKLNLVDLAGSEKLTTNYADSTGKETVGINLSLSTLASCIAALASHSKFVPFRDSKLTRLLKSSLGGDSRCLMIACISPSESAVNETLSTLRYASRVKLIKKEKNLPKLIDPTEQYILTLQQQIHKFKWIVMQKNIMLIQLWNRMTKMFQSTRENENEKEISEEEEKAVEIVDLTVEQTEDLMCHPSSYMNTPIMSTILQYQITQIGAGAAINSTSKDGDTHPAEDANDINNTSSLSVYDLLHKELSNIKVQHSQQASHARGKDTDDNTNMNGAGEHSDTDARRSSNYSHVNREAMELQNAIVSINAATKKHINQLQHQVQLQTDQYIEMQETLMGVNRELKTERSVLEKKNEEIDELRDEVSRLKQQLEDKTSELSECHERMQNASAVVSEMQCRLNEVIANKSHLKQAEKEITKLKHQLAATSNNGCTIQ